ncbi:MAG TPA: glycosyltransferase [Flavipsychrobacter sp.]|nr:glycosyltransferase [Flavipsychrobacter sp.]
MTDLKLHIVAFDIPYPPDYGGAIDVFYKVKNLSEAGVRIYLHCPVYGSRQPAAQLEALCQKVFYYPRNTGLKGISLRLPYMVYSRKSEDLLKNLQEIDAPILFDGVSTSYYLSHPALKKRLKILRPQNVEQDYFRLLEKREKNLFRKAYYLTEARLSKNYEDSLQHADAFFTVAQHDHQFFKEKYPAAVHEYIPSFQPYNEVESKAGNGSFCLYHGNLGLAENKEAALFLLNEVVPFVDFPFVIAGRNPDESLMALASRHENCRIIANPSMEEMERLITEAHIHVLPTFQNTGLKLKLLHALFNGRFVLVNEAMVHGTGLSSVCKVVKTAEGFISEIKNIRGEAFDQKDIEARGSLLKGNYDNKGNADRIVTFLQQRSL